MTVPAPNASAADKGTLGDPVVDTTPRADWGVMPVGATDVDDRLIATLREWTSTYLSRTEVERALGTGFLPRPADGQITNALTSMEFMDGSLPAIIVTTADVPENAVKRTASPRGSFYSADWRVTVSSIVRGPTKQQTRYNASNFELTVRRLLLYQVTRMEGTQITELKWRGSNIAPVADTTGAGRYLAAGIGQYTASVDMAVQDDVGPLVPADSYGELALVETWSVDVEPLTIEEQP